MLATVTPALATMTPSAPLVGQVRAVNDRFKDVSAALAEGYTPIPCASGLQGGAMGVHYVSSKYLKDRLIEINHPESDTGCGMVPQQ
jgi:hypothetical protein